MKSLYKIMLITIGALVVISQVAAFAFTQTLPLFLAVPAALAVGLVLTFALVQFKASGIVKIIKQCIASASAVEHGEKGEPIETNRQDELGQLVNAMNRLLDRDKATKQANEDPLTGLANRRFLTQRLEQVCAAGTSAAVIFIDLDGFKPINDEYGHEVGDIALKMVSERLGTCVRETDVLCRLGGDEFVVMFVGMEDREVITQRADKILEMIGQPYWIENNRIRMGASLGIAIHPEDGKTAEEVLNAADESMYAAKQGGKNAYRFYS